MRIRFHPHALERLVERNVTETEVRHAVESGERLVAKLKRTGFRTYFNVEQGSGPRTFDRKQVEVCAVWEDNTWLVITVIVKYFQSAEQRR